MFPIERQMFCGIFLKNVLKNALHFYAFIILQHFTIINTFAGFWVYPSTKYIDSDVYKIACWLERFDDKITILSFMEGRNFILCNFEIDMPFYSVVPRKNLFYWT
jgi:hypothetical protein